MDEQGFCYYELTLRGYEGHTLVARRQQRKR